MSAKFERPPLILVVDDEPAITMTATAILEMHGYRTALANDGDAGLERARELRPDLVLSDVVMPKKDGVRMAVEIVTSLPGTKILLFSGSLGKGDIIAAGQRLGFEFPLLAKPVPLELLIGKIRDILADNFSDYRTDRFDFGADEAAAAA